LQSVISLERQLPRNFTLAVSFIDARSSSFIAQPAINAPLPGLSCRVFQTACATFGNENFFQFESTALQPDQLIVNVQNRFGRTSRSAAYYVLEEQTATLMAQYFSGEFV